MSKIKVRRLKKKIADNKKKIMFISLFLLLFFIGSSYALLSTTADLSGATKIVTVKDVEDNCPEGYSASMQITNEWENNGRFYYVYTITLNNGTNEDLQGWEITAKGPSDLELSYGNVDLTINSDNSLTMKDKGWNAVINAHNSYTLEVCLMSIERNFKLDLFEINGCSLIGGGTKPVDPDDPIDPDEPDNPAVELESFTINPNNYEIDVEESVPLQIVKNPENAEATFNWVSSDSSIATVDNNGNVTGIKEGTVTITATSNNNKTATSIITVKPTSTSPTDPVIPDKPMDPDTIDFQFTNLYSFQNTFQFQFDLTNTTEETIRSFTFELELPEGTEYNFWRNPGVTVEGNKFIVNLWDWEVLTPGKSTQITGYVTMPEGTDATAYKTVVIKNLTY